MQLKEIMSENVQCIHPEQTLHAAAVMMKDHEIGLLPVIEDDHVIGTVTDRDIVVYGIAEGKQPQSTQIHDVMTEGVITCRADADVDEAAELMKRHKVRRLVVTDDQSRPIGIISLGDLATLADDEQMTQDVLERVSTGNETRPTH